MADMENSTAVTIAIEEVGKEKKASPVKRSSEAGADSSPAKKIMKTEEEVNGEGDAASVEAEPPKTEKMNGKEEVAVEASNDANGKSEKEADAVGEKEEKENLAKEAPDGVETEKSVASTDAEAKSEAEGKKTAEDNGKPLEADAAVTKEEATS